MQKQDNTAKIVPSHCCVLCINQSLLFKNKGIDSVAPGPFSVFSGGIFILKFYEILHRIVFFKVPLKQVKGFLLWQKS